MAGFQKIYTSENEYLYDLGKSTGYFDEEYYNIAKESGKGYEYLKLMASAKDNISSTFDPVLYNKLSGEDKFNYFATENFMDKSSTEYKNAVAYYTQKQQQIKQQEIYDGLNFFEKTMNSIGGWLGNTFLQVGGIVEGLIDVGAEALGSLGIISGEKAKDFISKDTTGYNAAQTAMNDWINKYTFIDKNIVTRAINDVSTGIMRMAPMIVGGLAGPIGSKIGAGIYYASMAGNTAEQAITANPDIDYADLLLYTGASVGLEYLTEWASAKLFGDDIVSSLIKGEKYAPTGSIVKNIAKNFGTEALEEATSELFGSILYKTMVDPTADTATFADILYAAVIGGLTGAVMSGGQVLTTKRKSVFDGKLVDTSSLTKEQRKQANNLGIAKSYSLNNLLSQVQQGLQTTDEITKLMAKYGTSINNIAITHQQEYEEALAKDNKTKSEQAKVILDLANILNTIGVEQFTKSAELLTKNVEAAQTAINNYLTHTDQFNKAASAAFSAAFKDYSFEPSAQPTKSEQSLVKALRAAYPNKKIVFGKFGSKDGLATRPINTTGDWIFIESGLVDKMGYKNIMQHTIRNELANNILTELSTMKPQEVNALVGLITDDKKNYSELSTREKKALAQIICFDPIQNKRLFFRNKETHAKIFNYITSQSEYVKRFGRQTEANKIRYHDLLAIRDLFLDNIATSIFNDEDVKFVANKYGLGQEELQTKVTDKTKKSTLNDVLKVTNISFSKASILKREAIDELLNNRVDQTTDFDYNRIYDESYYSPEYVSRIKEQQQSQEFEKALKIHFETSLKTTLSDYSEFVNAVTNNVSIKDFRKIAKIILTNEFLSTNPTDADLMFVIANKLWTMTDVVYDDSADSIIVTDNQIQGTGELKFFKGDVYERYDLFNESEGYIGTGTGKLSKRLGTNQGRVEPTIVTGLNINLLPNESLNFYQRDLQNITKSVYNINLHFYNGRPITTSNGKKQPIFGFFVTGSNEVYVRTDKYTPDGVAIQTLRHEITHWIIENYSARYASAKIDMFELLGKPRYEAFVKIFEKMYPKHQAEEEMLVALLNTPDENLGDVDTNEFARIKKYFYDGIEDVFTTQYNYNPFDDITESDDVKYAKQVKLSKQTPQKQPKVSTQILKRFEDGSKKLSEVQYSESNSKEYLQVSYDMIDEMADTFALVNDNNYDEIRNALKNSKKPYAQQALRIFDLYTIEMVGKFKPDIAQKIENNYQKTASGAGQTLALQAQRVAERKPISDTISTLKNDGFNVTVTDEIVQLYDSKLKDKEAYIKELEQQIKDLEKQLQTAKNDIDKAALNKQLKEVSDKKGVIQSGSNSDILDHILTHIDSPEQMTKLQEDMLGKLLNTAIKAQEEGKKVGYYIYDENGQPKPFPKATEKLTKTLKKLKSFRMWSMLSSPVTWVRNWLGNQGMKSLDAMTNFVEGFMTSRSDFDKNQMKFTESRAGNDLYNYIAEQNEKYIMSLVRGEDVKYETSAEKAADIKRRERQIEYESANAFRKACLKAQDMADWGLSTGPLGDEPVVFRSICKNMGNLVANNINFLLQGIQAEANLLSKRTTLTEKEQARLDTLHKAITTKDAKNVFNALSKEETTRLFDICKERSFQQYFKNPNVLSKWLSKFGAKHPVYAELISWVMPFPKVAANVLSMAYRYSPLSFFKGLSEMSKYKQMQDPNYKGPSTGFEKAQMIRTFSEATVGTFMLIAGAIFSAMGLVDIDDDDYMGPCIKIGDFKVSLSDLAPSMTTFSTASAVVWAWKNDRVGVTDALNVLYDNTLLGNVESLLTYGSFTDIAKNVSISYISQYIPAVLKLINKGITGGVKKDKSGNYLQRLVKTLGSYVPGLSQLVPNKIDPYTGKKVYQAGSENWFLNLLASLSPLGISWDGRSELEKQAELLGAESSGLSGRFSINDIDYTVKNKDKYAKYRANYIQDNFDKILSGKQKVTVEDENGKRITTTYDKLNDKQKKNVINRLYTDATAMTKIKWWTDQGNKYVVTNRDQYNEYRKMFSNIIYKKTWSKSKFVES